MTDIQKIKDKDAILDFVLITEILYTEDEAERIRLLHKAQKKADELGVLNEFRQTCNSLRLIKDKDDEEHRLKALTDSNSAIETDKNGVPKKTVENFLRILTYDADFSSLRYNELKGRAEFEGKIFGEAEFSRIVHRIEANYGLKSERDLEHAINIVIKERRYHPIQEKIRSIKWDGGKRIENFLTAFMDAGVSDYARECSRLIFHCGIARIFNPGCKVDDIVVLQGPQGNGKTTITQWLCMDDDWYGRLSDLKGNTGIEQIQGKWICEISELLALNNKASQEEAKQFFDRKVDTYRKPYGRYPEDIPRSCIFIGTTNLRQPFIDKTGNRRYYPIWCNVERGVIFEYEGPIKYYIEQCWAEAYALWCEGKIRHSVCPEMIETVTEHQKNALEDDWRVGTIEEYIGDKDCVCVLELWEKALGYKEKPTAKQSKEIGLIMDGFTDWKRNPSVKLFEDYGRQRSWKRNEPVVYESFEENF